LVCDPRSASPHLSMDILTCIPRAGLTQSLLIPHSHSLPFLRHGLDSFDADAALKGKIFQLIITIRPYSSRSQCLCAHVCSISAAAQRMVSSSVRHTFVCILIDTFSVWVFWSAGATSSISYACHSFRGVPRCIGTSQSYVVIQRSSHACS
jgi:hypothetical protein